MKNAIENETEKKMLKTRQRGITMIEITAGLVIIALLAIFLVPRVGALLGKAKIETAVQEVTILVTAFEQYRLVERSYTGITLATLEQGYHIEPFGTGTGEAQNTFGQDIDFASGNGSTLTLTYSTGADNQGDCQQIATRIGALTNVTAGDCEAGDVTFTIGQ